MEKLSCRQRRIAFREHFERGERNIRRLAEGAGVSARTAYRLRILLENGDDLKPKYATPKKRKFTSTVRRQMAQLLAQQPRQTSTWLAREIGRRSGVEVSSRGVRKVLHELGYHNGKPKRCSLTPENKCSRLSFAREHVNTDWNRIWAYDESYFNLNLGSRQVWFKDSLYHRVAPQKLTNKQNSVSICIAVAISHNRKSRLCFLPKSYTPAQLIDVLQNELLVDIGWNPQLRQYRAFLMDNDGRHHNRDVVACLRENHMDRIGFMPPNSPDINPVENVFSVMKNLVRSRAPQTEAELRNTIEDAWEDIDVQTLQNLFRSMPGRMQDVIDNHGDRIPY